MRAGTLLEKSEHFPAEALGRFKIGEVARAGNGHAPRARDRRRELLGVARRCQAVVVASDDQRGAAQCVEPGQGVVCGTGARLPRVVERPVGAGARFEVAARHVRLERLPPQAPEQRAAVPQRCGHAGLRERRPGQEHLGQVHVGASAGRDQHELRDALRDPQGEFLRDHPAHAAADKPHALDAEFVEQANGVFGQVGDARAHR